VFLPGGNALNPTCLKWFLPLAERHRLYALDIVGQPGRSAYERSSPKGDGHAFWVEDVLDGIGLIEPAPLVGISYGAGIAIRTMGLAPERVSRAALVSPAGIATGPFLRILAEIGVPTLLYRLSPTEARLVRAAMPLYTEPEDPAFTPAVRQLGAALRHLRLDADLPPPRPGRDPRRLPPRPLEVGSRSGERAHPCLPRGSRRYLGSGRKLRAGP
jgi:pimeloyl-ACP methyl ester carboxylesterase